MNKEMGALRRTISARSACTFAVNQAPSGTMKCTLPLFLLASAILPHAIAAPDPQAAVKLVTDIYREHPGPLSILREETRENWAQWFEDESRATLQRPDWLIDPLFLSPDPAARDIHVEMVATGNHDANRSLIAVTFTPATGEARRTVVVSLRHHQSHDWRIYNIVDAESGTNLLHNLLAGGPAQGPPADPDAATRELEVNPLEP